MVRASRCAPTTARFPTNRKHGAVSTIRQLSLHHPYLADKRANTEPSPLTRMPARSPSLWVDFPVRRRRATTAICAFRPKTGIGERRPRQIIRYQQTWRPLSAHLADPRRSLCAWARSRQAGSKKPVAWENAAAATPQYCHCRARQQGCADRLELVYQRLRNKSAGAITTCPFSPHASPSTTRPRGPIARPVWPSRC
jgi:hypothetical protein